MYISRFWKIYFIAVSVTACLLACGFSVFYRFMASYEESQPQYAVMEYADQISSTHFSSLIREALPKELSPYETEDSVHKTYTDTLDEIEGTISARKNYLSYSSSKPVFYIMKGDTEIAEVTLEKAPNGAFGMDRWHVCDAHVILDDWAPQKTTYSLYVPTDAALVVNGITVPSEHASETALPYGYRSTYEPDAEASWVLYRIEGLYGVPSVVADYNGEACPVQISGKDIFCLYPASCTKTYKVTVPTEASVTANGVLLADDMITQTDIQYPYHSLEKSAEALPTAKTYTLEGLFAPPQIVATLNGFTLECAQTATSYTAVYSSELLYTCNVYVPIGSEVSVYGTVLPAESATKQPAFPALTDFIPNMPEYDVYTLAGFYASPADFVSVKKDGEAIPVSITVDGYTVTARAGYPSVENDELSERAIAFAKDYINYTGQGYNNIDYNLNKVLRYVIYGTETYKRISNSRIGISYVTPVTSNVYNKLETVSIIQYTDDLYECTVEFDVDQATYTAESNYSGSFKLVLTRIYGTFMVTDMYINAN